MEEVAEANQLTSLEKIRKRFKIETKPFMPGVLLSATMKLKRREASKYYSKAIEQLYSGLH